MTDIRDALRSELGALEQQLQDDPRFQKIQHLQQLLSLYDGGPAGTSSAPSAARARARRQGSQAREEALTLAANFIEGRSEPTRTSDIFEYVVGQGVVIDGQSPVSNLSAMLSRSELFISHGRAGWTLAPGVIRSDNPDGAHDRALRPSDEADQVEDLLGDTE